VAVVLLGWGFRPEGRTVHTLRLDVPESEGTGDAHPVREVRLEYPEQIRLNDRAQVRISFEVAADGTGGQNEPDSTIGSTADAVHAVAEARLEIPDASVRPPDSIHEALAAEKPLQFYWTVVLRAPGEYRGTAWSFLTIQDESSAGSRRIALGAQNVEIRSITLLGMSGEAARIAGGLSLIAGLVFGLPFIEPALRAIFKG